MPSYNNSKNSNIRSCGSDPIVYNTKKDSLDLLSNPQRAGFSLRSAGEYKVIPKNSNIRSCGSDPIVYNTKKDSLDLLCLDFDS